MKNINIAITLSAIIIIGTLIFMINQSQKNIETNINMNQQITHLDWEEFQKEAKNDNVVVIDIRTQDEISDGKLFDNALEIDYYQSDFEQKITELDPTKTYALYCRSGGRSGSALSVFKEYGLNAFDLDGGYNAAQ